MIFAQILALSSAAAILLFTIAVIAKMTFNTNHGIRAAFILISAGSFGEILSIIQLNHSPGVVETILFVGYALLTFVDRRNVDRCNLPDGVPCRDPQAKVMKEWRAEH